MTDRDLTNQDELLLQAQRVIRELRNKLAARSRPSQEPVAIIGMACRFPCGSGDLDAFWRLTLAGANTVRDLPPGRWDTSSYLNAGPGKPAFRACFLEQPYAFDADFFGISSREAMQMDPAQRLFLEVAWRALEDAGQTKRSLAASDTAVFAGNTGVGEFLAQQLSASSEIDVYTGTGTGPDVIAGRLAYLLDLQGPCATINTACSSSLVALHLARRSLLAGECSMAIAGGVNILGPVATAMASRMDFLAPDGCCKPFDERADGFGRGEGCGVVILKRLSDAIAAHDRVLAVIHGSAMNQDGRTNGLTAPNGRSQVALLRRALKDAGIEASQVGYVEAHGTGTPLGDPIEVEAISEVLGIGTSPCGLGSAKGNIGHLEGAAGIAGVIRAVLIMRNGVIPPVASFRGLNPHISLSGTRLFVPSTPTPWPGTTEPRYAGVSSFGWSGTNAHLILGEAPMSAERIGTPGFSRDVIVPVSAADPASLQTLIASIARAAKTQSETDLATFAWSAGARRSHHAHRVAVVGDHPEDIAAKLLERAPSKPHVPHDSAPKITIIFAAAQTNSSKIITELSEQEPVFKDALERCALRISSAGGRDVLAPGNRNVWEISGAEEEETTATFLLQFGLTELLKSWGIRARDARGEGIGAVMAALTNRTIDINQAVAQVVNGRNWGSHQAQSVSAQRSGTLNQGFTLLIGHGHQGLDHEGEGIIHLLRRDRPARRSMLEAVSALYEAGLEIEWDAVSGSDRRFIPLPAYPFRHETDALSRTGSARIEAPDDWFYETAWTEMPIPVRAMPPAQPRIQTRATKWVIVADKAGFAEQLVQAVSHAGDEAILIPPYQALLRGDDDRIDEIDAVDRALEGIERDQPVIVVHLPALDLVDVNLIHELIHEIESHGDAKRNRASQLNPAIDTLMGLVLLFRALENKAASGNIKLWVVTRGAQRLHREVSASSLMQSPLWGFSASAALEHPDLWGGIVDLDPHPSADEATLLIQHLVTHDAESRALFREGRRHVARLRRATPPPNTPVKIDTNATYLITGAFGGIGLSLTEWLIASGAKHLVLLGRHLASINKDSESSIEHWQAAGVTVQHATCDVADLDRMSLLFSQVTASGPPIRGILHAAAEVIWKPLIDLDHAGLRASFHAKVEGSLVLHELSRDLSLDFLVFFSSAAVAIGAREGAAYAAANAFMDSLALHRRGMGLPTRSIQWGNWHRKTAHTSVDQQQFDRSGFQPMPPQLATNALGRLLAQNNPSASHSQVMIAHIDRPQLKAATAMRGQSLFLSELPSDRPQLPVGESPLLATLRALPRSRRIETLTDLVVSHVRRTLGWTAKHPVDPLRGFFDMGFDSLKSIELKNALSKATGLSLSSTLVMTYPNVNAVTEFLHSLLFGEEPQNDTSQTIDATAPISESLTDAQAHEALAAELELLRGRFDV